MVDDAKLHQFMGQMLSDLGGAASVALVRIGDALGLYKTLHERGPMTVTELAAESIFGEMALIDSEPRSATAIAITDVELVPVSEKQFLFLVSQTPYFGLKVMRVLAQRLRATNKTFC